MATTEKNSGRFKKAASLINKVKGMLPGKKATPKRANKPSEKLEGNLIALKDAYEAKKKKMAKKGSATSEAGADAAHAPGHKKLNVKGQFAESSGDKAHPQNPSALNRASGSDFVFRHANPQRRIIPGASIERKGRTGNKRGK